MAESPSVAIEQIARDAQEAWDEGRQFYAPRMTVLRDEDVVRVAEVEYEMFSAFVGRHILWEDTIGVITRVGWQLDSWTASSSEVRISSIPVSVDKAFALFSRPSG